MLTSTLIITCDNLESRCCLSRPITDFFSNLLVVSGDAVYNNTHLYLAECDGKARGEWLRALDKIEALHARAVVAGHGVLDPDSSPGHIEETRRYIRDFNLADAGTATAMGLYEKMLALHPNRVNPGSLWATAKTVKPSPTSG